MSSVMAAAAVDKCEILMCSEPAGGTGPRSGLRLCLGHLAADVERVRRLKVDTDARIGDLRETLRSLEPRRQRLAADLRELESIFDGLQAGLQRWREDVVGGVRGQHESLNSKILTCQHVVGYERAIREAERAGNFRRVYELAGQVEPTIELLRPRDGGRTGLLTDATPSQPDVCSAVLNARFHMDQRMARLAGDLPAEAPACEFRRTLRGLGGEVECLAACANTEGVHCSADSGARLLEKGAKGAKRPLAPPCLFVSYDVNEKANYLLVIELNSAQRFHLICEIDWSQAVTDLHCDDRAQRLFVAQGEDGITVVTLWGAVLHKINTNSLEHRLGAASGLDGSRDLLYVLDGKQKRLLAIAKDSFTLNMDMDIAAFYSGRPWLGGLAVSGSRLLVTDKGGRAVHKVCSLTQRLIASYPTGASQTPLHRPTGIAVDSRGVVCVSDSWSQTVQLFLADGSLVQVLGSDGQSGPEDDRFDGPQGVALLEYAGRRLLYVADWRNQAVKEFQLH